MSRLHGLDADVLEIFLVMFTITGDANVHLLLTEEL